MTPSEHRLIKAAVDMRMAQKKYYEYTKLMTMEPDKAHTLLNEAHEQEKYFDFILKDIQTASVDGRETLTVKTIK